LDEFDGDTGFFGRARAGGDDDAIGLAADDVVDGDFVVAMDFDLATELAEVLGEVVGEGVVVVEEEDHAIAPPGLFSHGLGEFAFWGEAPRLRDGAICGGWRFPERLKGRGIC